jgi:hypothetical protein
MMKWKVAIALAGAVMVASACSSAQKETSQQDAASAQLAQGNEDGANRTISEQRGNRGRWRREAPRDARQEQLGVVTLSDFGTSARPIRVDRFNCGLTHLSFTAQSDSVRIFAVSVTYRGGQRDQIDLNDSDDFRPGDWRDNGRRRPGGRGIYLERGESTGWLDEDDVLDGRSDGRCVQEIVIVGEEGFNGNRRQAAEIRVAGLIRRRDGGGGHGGGGGNRPKTDEQCYLERYEDLRRDSSSRRDPWGHFKIHGQREGRIWGCQSAEAICYLNQNPDICKNYRDTVYCKDPRRHYDEWGHKENRKWGCR